MHVVRLEPLISAAPCILLFLFSFFFSFPFHTLLSDSTNVQKR